jgi:ribonuclease Z
VVKFVEKPGKEQLMPKLIILGSSNAIPDLEHENTHMAFVGQERRILVDCVNNPIVRLKQAGIDIHELTDLLLTHFHPDHVSGVPSLLMNSWLLGRKAPLNIYGLDYTLERIQKLMHFYDWETWPNFFPVNFVSLPEEEMTPVLESREMRFFASPVEHLVPTIGLRVEFPQSGKVLAYSCDTEPCPQVVRLASGADVLIHEATGDTLGHSSAAQAGEIARQAEVGKLLLIHYQTGDFDPRQLMKQARQTFAGEVGLAEDFMQLEF